MRPFRDPQLNQGIYCLSAEDLEKKAKLVIVTPSLALGISKMADGSLWMNQAKKAEQLVKQMIAQVGRLQNDLASDLASRV